MISNDNGKVRIKGEGLDVLSEYGMLSHHLNKVIAEDMHDSNLANELIVNTVISSVLLLENEEDAPDMPSYEEVKFVKNATDLLIKAVNDYKKARKNNGSKN